ncbi:MAG: NUDIX hydrolase [Candidatus Saccharibacteria bacterium]|nr:NUDIX hydrolase [Candidatus Saccharibacteria bacterium]
MSKELKVIIRAIVVNQDRVLLVKKTGADFWHFPGGKWEFARENIKQAIQRESIEETGYQIQPIEVVFTQELREDNKVYLELFWQAELITSDQLPVAPEEEIQNYQWFDINDLASQSINFKPNNPTIIDILQRFVK